MLRDRRGVGVAEYAILLFLMVAVAAVVFRYMGKNVKHAGNKTEEQFQSGAASSAGGKSAGGSNSAGGAGSAAAGGTAAAGGNNGTGGGGGGSAGGGGGGGGGSATSNTSGGGGAGGDEEEEHSTPLWKIIGGVFVLLFGIGGYFAFRKQGKGG